MRRAVLVLSALACAPMGGCSSSAPPPAPTVLERLEVALIAIGGSLPFATGSVTLFAEDSAGEWSLAPTTPAPAVMPSDSVAFLADGSGTLRWTLQPDGSRFVYEIGAIDLELVLLLPGSPGTKGTWELHTDAGVTESGTMELSP